MQESSKQNPFFNKNIPYCFSSHQNKTTQVEEAMETKIQPAKEAVLKKRRRDEEWAAQRAIQHANKLRKMQGSGRKAGFIRAEWLVQDYLDIEKDQSRFEKAQKTRRKYQLPETARLGFAIRLYTHKKIYSQTREVFKKLNLNDYNEGVFFAVTDETSSLLDLVKPYVIWGYPSHRSVKELIYKRGQGKGANQERIPLTDNAWIEDRMGEFGVICIEDLVHEICSLGEYFQQVNDLLWPFKLSVAKDEITRRFKKYIQVGKKGNREEQIDLIINKMN
eukprot:TRINITY_DN33503_c0_g1_i2.p1 TRINITY_DN33503_c0_g1~~TRINITY_DN33503_c0_g1_i2.p1  ORF type:complete len:315 (-),score=30.46 TRINITY_DN33503_c0_g1_i2:224-1054(-)